MVDRNGWARDHPVLTGSLRHPPTAFLEQANVTDSDIYDEFDERWPECWERAADLLSWDQPYETVLEDEDAPFYRWFTGGRLNAAENCIDRHLEEKS